MATPSRIFLNRIKKELSNLENDPPPGITCYPINDDITHLECYLQGPTQTPYEKGIFQLDIKMPSNYPFEPPQIRFITPIYHPNIDEVGRICASILKKTDDGWKPSMNLSTTLISLHNLISAPNPDDPLDAEIANEYKMDYEMFLRKAKEYTLKHAMIDLQNKTTPSSQSSSYMSTDTITTTITTDHNPIENDNQFNQSMNYKKTVNKDNDDDISSPTITQSTKKSKLSLSTYKSNSQQTPSSQDSSTNKKSLLSTKKGNASTSSTLATENNTTTSSSLSSSSSSQKSRSVTPLLSITTKENNVKHTSLDSSSKRVNIDTAFYTSIQNTTYVAVHNITNSNTNNNNSQPDPIKLKESTSSLPEEKKDIPLSSIENEPIDEPSTTHDQHTTLLDHTNTGKSLHNETTAPTKRKNNHKISLTCKKIKK